MKKKTKMKHHVQKFNDRCMKALPALLIMLCSALTMKAQYNTQFFSWDPYSVKGYATELVPNGNNRETVMAGTYYDRFGYAVPHFMKMSGGNPPDYPNIVNENLFPDANFRDQYVVDVVAKDYDEYFMIISAREDINNQPVPKDKIKIILTDNAAANNGERIYFEMANDYNMYPLSAMYDNNTDYLYICGFVTTEPTTYPFFPDENSPKHAFIMSIHIVDITQPGTWNIMNANYFESSPPYMNPKTMTGETDNMTEKDFDMAMHMQFIQNGADAGNIFMTGSINATTETLFQATGTYVRSATMVHILDPVTLSDLYGNELHLVDYGTNDGDGTMEYGVALVEGAAGTGDDNYVISNFYDAASTNDGTPPNDWHNTIGFNAKANRIAITHLNHEFRALRVAVGYPSTTRMILNPPGEGLYAVQVLPSNELADAGNASYNSAPAGTILKDQTRFNLVGMAYGTPITSYSCSLMSPLNYPISDANIVPFIYSLDIAFYTKTTGNADNIEGSIKKRGILQYTLPNDYYGSMLKLYDNQTGTGDPLAYTNTYANLGNGMSHIFYAPDFAVYDDNDPNLSIILNAPKWRDSYPNGTLASSLGLKTMFVDNNQDGALELDGYCHTHCDVESSDDVLKRLVNQEIPPTVTEDPSSNNTSAPIHVDLGDCSGNPSVFKTTAVNVLEEAGGKTSVYPNPASDQLYVELDASVHADARVKVLMLNMQGQLIQNLYEGSANNAKGKALSIPSLPIGLYMVEVYADGVRIHYSKLNIE